MFWSFKRMKSIFLPLFLAIFVSAPVPAQLTADLESTGLAVNDDTLSQPLFFPDVRNEPVIGAGFVAFAVHEGSQDDADLTGDGDSIDFVVHVRDLVDGSIINLDLAVASYDVFGGANVNLVAIDNLLIFLASEASGGSDLNGDEDTLDLVTHIYDKDTGATTNLGTTALARGRRGLQ